MRQSTNIGEGTTGQKEVVPHPSHPSKSPSRPTPSSSPPRASSSPAPTPCSTTKRKSVRTSLGRRGRKKGRTDIYPDGPPLLRKNPSPSAAQEREHVNLHICGSGLSQSMGSIGGKRRRRGNRTRCRMINVTLCGFFMIATSWSASSSPTVKHDRASVKRSVWKGRSGRIQRARAKSSLTLLLEGRNVDSVVVLA